MSIKRLPYFLSAAKNLSFTEAANEHFISQTAISLQIKKYEEELGFKLFERSNTGVTLTMAGGYLYKRGQFVMADYNRAVSHARQLSEAAKPKLSIGYSGAYEQVSVAPFVLSFYQHYPSSQVDLVYCHTKKTAIQYLEDGIIDIAVISAYDRNYNQWFKSRTLTRNDCVFVLPADHELASRGRISPSLLKGVPIIISRENDFSSFEWRTRNLLVDLGLGENEVIYANDYYALTMLIRAGLGTTLVPDCMSEIYSEGIAYVGIEGEPIRMSTSAVFRESSVNPMADEFTAMLDRELQKK